MTLFVTPPFRFPLQPQDFAGAEDDRRRAGGPRASGRLVLAGAARVTGPGGELRASTLGPGASVLLDMSGTRHVATVTHRRYSGELIALRAGDGRRLMVLPGQVLRCSDPRCELWFGTAEVCFRAEDLAGHCAGARRVPVTNEEMVIADFDVETPLSVNGFCLMAFPSGLHAGGERQVEVAEGHAAPPSAAWQRQPSTEAASTCLLLSREETVVLGGLGCAFARGSSAPSGPGRSS